MSYNREIKDILKGERQVLFTNLHKQTKLEMEIDCILEILSIMPPESKEYSIIADNLEKLYKAKHASKNGCVSKDTIVIVLGNLLGIVLILGYERANIITTKAIQFVLKGRV